MARKYLTKPNKLKFKNEYETIAFIHTLPQSHHAVIGRLIWWDYYASRTVANRTAAFDHWLRSQGDHWNEPPNEELADSLVLFGYDREFALRRVAFGNTLKVGYGCGGTRGRGV